MYKVFISIVIIHFSEHLAQLYQLYILGWERSKCLGLIGLKYPWLMQTEWLHYIFAAYMLVALITLQPWSINKNYWNIAIGLQTYHYIEHLILLTQYFMGIEMVNRVSIGSFLLPRLELHFVYNLMVIIPMLIACIDFNKLKIIR